MQIKDYANLVAQEMSVKSGLSVKAFDPMTIIIIIQIIIALVKMYKACKNMPEISFAKPGFLERKWIQFTVWRNCSDRELRAPMREAILASMSGLNRVQIRELFDSVDS